MPFPLSRDRRIAHLYDYWNGLRSSGGVPSVRDFDPVDVGPLLTHLWMARWEREAQDFVYRLAGEGILSANRRPMRLLPLSKIYSPAIASSLRVRYQRICTTPAIYHAQGTIYVHLDRFGTGERLILPLLDMTGSPTMVIGCTVYALSNWSQNKRPSPTDEEPEIQNYLSLDADPIEQVKEAC
jgi:hypothetical protein